MIKQIKLLVLILLCATCCQGQVREGLNLGLVAGPKYGIIANQMNYGQKELDYKSNKVLPEYEGSLGYNFDSVNIISLGAGVVRVNHKYIDNYAAGNILAKNIDLKYLSFFMDYMIVIGGRNQERRLKFFISAGPRLNMLRDAGVDHYINNTAVSLIDFATYKTDPSFINEHAEALIKLVDKDGDPASDEELFKAYDLQASLGAGLLCRIGQHLNIGLTLQGGASVLDINNSAWKISGYADGKYHPYEPSRNVFGRVMLKVLCSL